MPAKKRPLKSVPGTGKTRKQNPGTAARNAAIGRMIESYPEAWEQFLAEERTKRGLPAEGTRQTRLDKFVAAMKAEGVEDAAIQMALKAAGFKKGQTIEPVSQAQVVEE